MAIRFWRRCGCPLSSEHGFELGDRRFRVGAKGLRTLKLLEELDRLRDDNDRGWLVRARPIIRDVQQLEARATLSYVAARAKDPVLRILACWLRGRCGGNLGTAAIAALTKHADWQTRKEATRALRRMSAWSRLSVIAANESHDRVRRLAICRPSRPIAERIAHFVQPTARRPIFATTRRLFLAPQLELNQKHPPKSPQLIREILLRLQRLISGQKHAVTHKD